MTADSWTDVLLGFGLGALGIVPFLHTNTLLAGLPEASALLVVVLAFSHLAFETLPAVFFGVPSESQGVSALPAHELVRQGRSREALDAALHGLLVGLLAALASAAAFWLLGPAVRALLRPWTAWLLAAVSVLVWASDGLKLRHALALAVFAALGAAVFSLPMTEPLFPLLSGLFGVPALLFSGGAIGGFQGPSVRMPRRPAFIGGLLGALTVFLPALSPSWAASIALLLLPAGPREALVLVSAVASGRMVFEFLAVPVLGVARSAASVRWRELAVGREMAVVLLAVGVVAFFLAWRLCAHLAPAWSRVIRRVPPRRLAVLLLAASLLGAWALDPAWGPFVLAWASCASVLSVRLGVPRKYALGALVGPAFLHAWGAA